MDTTRRLDALLARHLFGLDASYRMVTKDKDRLLWDWTRPDLPMIQMWVVPGGPGDYCEMPHYATTYGGMGEVIEAMRMKRYYSQIVEWPDGHVTCDWRDAQLRVVASATGTNLPLAVALAAARVWCPEELGESEADEYILGEDVTHLARPKARDNQETSASSPAQQIDVRGEEGQCDAV